MGEASVSRRQRAYEPRAPLVNQVDADELDDGVVEMLVDGVEKAVCRFKVSPGGVTRWFLQLISSRTLTSSRN